MKKHQIKSEISFLLETITEQNQIINSHQQNIPQIELDIIMDNLRKLYQAYAVLNKLNSFDEIMEQDKLEKSLPVEPLSVTEEKDEKIEEAVNEVSEKEEKKEEQKLEQQAPLDLSKELIEEPQVKLENVEKTEPFKKHKPDLFTETMTMSDKYKNDTKSINEKIAQNLVDKTLASKIKKTPISDLPKAIGINEKFRIINELFDGNLADYNDVILRLNNFNGIEEAAQYLESLLNKYKWKADNQTFSLLSELIGRRYMQ